MNIDEFGKISPSIPDLTEARVDELRRASRSISDLVMSQEHELRELSASADRFRKILRGSFESQFREAMRASEAFYEIAGDLPVQRFEKLLPDLLMSGSLGEIAKRGFSDISRIQNEVAKAIGVPEAATRLQELSRIRAEISREATTASEALGEVIKGRSDSSTIQEEMSGMVGGLGSSTSYESERPSSSSLEMQEAPRDELMEQMSHDLAAIRQHMDRWWISLILIFLLTLLADILSPHLREKLSILEEPPTERTLREVD